MKRAGGASCLGRAYFLSPLDVFSKVGPEADEKGCGASKLSVGMTGAVVDSLVCVAAAEAEDSRGHPLAVHPGVISPTLRRHNRGLYALLLECCSTEDPEENLGGRRLLSTSAVHSMAWTRVLRNQR